METAEHLFESELRRRGIAASRSADGLYELEIDDCKVTVSLANTRREYARNRDARAVVEFVDQVTATLVARVPGWDEVRPFVRFCLEPADYEGGFGGTVRDTVTEDLCRVYAFALPGSGRITWIDESMLGAWGVTRDDVVRQAERNMRAIVEASAVEVAEIDGVKLGMLSTRETPFKASLILSPAFRQLVSPTHGWPVYVVAPCREFVYVISVADQHFLGRVGRVVVEEYHRSGHPITKDVLEVGDGGVRAVGTFPDA